MKKLLLLSGVAMLTAVNAEAMTWNRHIIDPYIGGEYVYSHAHQKGSAKNLKNNYNSGKADLGMQIYQNWDVEFSYQQSGTLKGTSRIDGQRVKNRFAAYALDLYGKYPIMCSNLGLLGTVGTAIYHPKFKNLPQSSFNRVGYRAGLGMQYDFNQHWAARVVGRYSYVGAKKLDDLKEVAVGMLYHF